MPVYYTLGIEKTNCPRLKHEYDMDRSLSFPTPSFSNVHSGASSLLPTLRGLGNSHSHSQNMKQIKF